MLVDAGRGAADDPAPLAIAMPHPVRAFEDRRLAGNVIANRGLHAGQVIRMHQAAPVRRAAHVLVRVAEHRLPARREIDLVALDIEIPEPIVRRSLGEQRALLELGQPRLDADALQPRGETRTQQLHQKLQVHVPGAARQRMAQAEESGGSALHPQSHEQRRSYLQLREPLGFGGLLTPRGAGVPQLGKAQMIQA